MKDKRAFSSKAERTATIGIVFLLILLVLGDVASAIVSSRAPVTVPPDLQTNRFGTFTMMTTQGANFYGPFPISFSPPFTAPPNDIKLVTLGSSGSFNVGFSTISFLNQGGSTIAGGIWTSMPAATNELFGNTCCRTWANMNGFSQGCFLVVDINILSNTPGAILFVQWATATAGPWTTFTGSSVDVNSIASNPRISTIFATTTGQAGPVYLRVAGSGGGGIGDNPQFTAIQMTCAGTLSGITLSWLSNTATGFNLFVTLTTLDPIGGNSIVIQWSAYLCTSGQGNTKC